MLKKVQKQYKKPAAGAIMKKCSFCFLDSPLRMTCWGTKEMSGIVSRWVLTFSTDDWKEFHQEWTLNVVNLVENVMKFKFSTSGPVITDWNYFSEVISMYFIAKANLVESLEFFDSSGFEEKYWRENIF